MGAGGLFHLRREGEKLKGPIANAIGEDVQRRLIEAAGIPAGGLILAIVGEHGAASKILGRLRQEVGRSLGMGNPDDFRFLWVNDFPLYEKDEDSGRIAPAHHFFSMPHAGDLGRLESDPLSVHAHLYDLVCNGVELASGSIRVHNRELQERIMAVGGIAKAEAAQRFGFLLDALEYGAPPHGGIAPGLDRIIMVLAGEDSIRDGIAFPKTQKATSLMDDAPSPVDPAQLEELGIRFKKSS